MLPSEEKDFLIKLQAILFVITSSVKIKLQLNYRVAYQNHFYSFEFVGKEFDISATNKLLEIFYQHKSMILYISFFYINLH